MRRGYKLRYIDWLYSQISENNPNNSDYHFLINYLHKTPFRSSVEMDLNRVDDGLGLRYMFDMHEGFSNLDCDITDECSALEVLIALAMRMEFGLLGSEYEMTVSQCFWVMMINLDIDYADDFAWFDDFVEGDVVKKVDIWLDREFDIRGNGSIFPQSCDTFDQREEELWDQMNTYLVNNYDF